MTYISMNYYLLVLAVLILYYVLPLNYRWLVLLAGNISFYYLFYKTGWWIFGLTVAAAFFTGLALTVTSESLKKLTMFLGTLLVFVPWFLIKNSNFFLEISIKKDPISWITPLGISFYTLQLISYIVDVYNGKIKPEKNIAKFILFASFFPQLIQGPIPRFNQLQNQLITGHRFDENNIVKGFIYIIWGFFLKLMIADKAAVIVDNVFNNYPAYSGVYIWVASFLYSIQLYTDFLACTTLAQGVSKLFGIDIIDNFARPYFATSIKDFWRRWHISLSSWLRDYIYIPLGGNRKGKINKYIFIAITFLVSGLWHGAGYRFLVWGGLHAIYQIVGDVTFKAREQVYNILSISPDSKKKHIIKQIGTFLLVNWAWIIFRADSLSMGAKLIKHMFTDVNPWILFNDQVFMLGLEWKEIIVLIVSILLLWMVGKYHERGNSVSDLIIRQGLISRWIVYIVAIVGIMLLGTYGYGFNAQDFIYGGF